jgi:hypothetical protein
MSGVAETHAGAEYNDDELEFIKAMDRFRHQNQRRFPTCCEMLRVLKELGYRKADGSRELGVGSREASQPTPHFPEP